MKEGYIANQKDKLKENISNVVESFYQRVGLIQEGSKTEDEDFIQIIYKAHEEWKSAEAFFDNVSDPDLIDHAIYKVEAAKSRYTYLIKKAKEEGIRVNFH
ncbi:YaaL family protein [Alkaliphilus peptidifermentans]|uniref:DUF2508 domain-containing protein n=1 Tax=Alkaliphilus peptidifermentans DSM 18978 TaxID=1120976 RepID=A0A1G5HGQ9_9FIRM|nr:YaaL family protein [Alkaliphilus peptidifermentans]SCY62218.1 Protein of unknown function [Alkaliphilus peptidifermentans DSM 18978]